MVSKTIQNPKTLGEEMNSIFNDIPEDPEEIGRRVVTIGEHTYHMRLKNPFPLWEFYPVAGGSLPSELHGSFTSQRAAETALSNYAARKSREGVVAKAHYDKLGPTFADRDKREIPSLIRNNPKEKN